MIIALSSDCPLLRSTSAPLATLHKDVQSNSVTRRHTAAFPNLWVATQMWVAELFSVGHETIIYVTILRQTCVCFRFMNSSACHIRSADTFLFKTHLKLREKLFNVECSEVQ